MRIFKTYTKKGVQISYLELEHKYLIKFEKGPVELTYKFRKGPGLEDYAAVGNFEETHVFDKVEPILQRAILERSNFVEDYFSTQFEFEEII